MLTFWEGTSKDSTDCCLGGLRWNVDPDTSQNLPELILEDVHLALDTQSLRPFLDAEETIFVDKV